MVLHFSYVIYVDQLAFSDRHRNLNVDLNRFTIFYRIEPFSMFHVSAPFLLGVTVNSYLVPVKYCTILLINIF